MRVFLDMEFTGLHQYTTLISIAMVTEYGDMFYGEFDDYDVNQIDEWTEENVIENLLNDNIDNMNEKRTNVKYKGDVVFIRRKMDDWFVDVLRAHDETRMEMWGDCMSYDWVLFNQIYGHSFNTPYFIDYIPFDICTLFKIAGIDPDINREEFVGLGEDENKHNALFDAQVIKECYNKLIELI